MVPASPRPAADPPDASAAGSQRLRPLDWVSDPGGGHGWVRLLDQTRLPHEQVDLAISDVTDLVAAIQRLSVRGAPALGVAGAFGVALAAQQQDPPQVRGSAGTLRSARPTAVNLARGVDRALAAYEQALASSPVEQGPSGAAAAALRAALALRDEEIAASTAMARRGADAVYEHATAGPAGLRLMTICNTGALAAVERGTALAVVEQVWLDGQLDHVIACETRPLLQGARLTAWELGRLGIPVDLVVDGAAAAVVRRGLVDAVLVGADRIAANGDTVNKIGTFALALAARYAAVPFFVVAPETTLDPATGRGDDVEIEDRGPEEVVSVHGIPIAPEGCSALNPAFDVTPAELITAIVTDRRVIDPSVARGHS